MNKWIKTITLTELKTNEIKKIQIGEHNIFLVYNENEIYCMENCCSHEKYELSGGIVEDGEIMCPEHGSRFSLRTGEPITLPATQPVTTYEVKVENDFIFCNLKSEA